MSGPWNYSIRIFHGGHVEWLRHDEDRTRHVSRRNVEAVHGEALVKEAYLKTYDLLLENPGDSRGCAYVHLSRNAYTEPKFAEHTEYDDDDEEI